MNKSEIMNFRKVRRAAVAISRIATRKPFILEIRGPLHIPCIEKFKGKWDYRRNHISAKVIGTQSYYTSPSVERKIAGFRKSVNLRYQKIERKLDIIVRKVNVLVRDLDRIEIDSNNLLDSTLYPAPDGKENKARYDSMIAQRRRMLISEKHEIQNLLADIKGIINSADKSMYRYQEVACEMVLTNLATYWNGVLKVANKKKVVLPPTLGNPVQKIAYDQRLKELDTIVDHALKR